MKRMAWKILFAAGIFVAVGVDQTAQAQMLMGSAPYNFPARNNSFAAQAQITQRLSGDGSGGSAGGLGALQQYVYSSSSTAIGNYNNVTVGDNSQATVKGDQDNNGNQGSTASTDISIGDKYTPGHGGSKHGPKNGQKHDTGNKYGHKGGKGQHSGGDK